ncbi:hypothetical protein [Bacteroides pyogenes]|uniref:Uncharacterized protein n=2 Tax=Bacteroides pyogenes TaxID=310300 RepID=W4PIY4_9BACE|nr:hypothetical protein [Bacteroides pyogenes]GAE16635.1 hypothetical protein JCM6292_3095 [Bacteroides pyogenes JCM 6292]GAE19099.1 hypothetical protein JCM6294_2108 [Bacteroides pyogenes DSM 20611 = JCM 6294]
MEEKYNIITMDGQGNITLPTDTGATTMTEWELCELFGVIAPTVRARIRTLCKSGVLRKREIKRTIRLSDKHSMEVYNLKVIIALAFRINTFGAEQVRRALLEGLCRRKENIVIFVSLSRKGNQATVSS